MTPRVTVLQLDTEFPRIAGDVGALQSYTRAPQIIRITGASVGQIVTDSPDNIDIRPFEDALTQATGDIIVTSCGFLSYWQDHLAAKADRPFIASSLAALDGLASQVTPEELMILTFSADALGTAHLRGHHNYTASILGLTPQTHLRQVISQNLTTLDPEVACAEITAHVAAHCTAAHRHILLECTNLPPYRRAIRAATGLPVTDILSLIEVACPGSVAAEFS